MQNCFDLLDTDVMRIFTIISYMHALGFRQVQGVDYDAIFSLVEMLKSVRIMLAIATFYEIWQMDVKTTFLNGYHIQQFSEKSIRECSFDIRLPDFIQFGNC